MGATRILRRAVAGIPALALALALVAAPAAASADPGAVEVELRPGGSTTITQTVTVEERPPKVDVLFTFDLTKSMGPVLSTAKRNATDVMRELESTPGMDTRFGAASYRDYPGQYSSGYYWAHYGTDGDYPYRLDQPVTDDAAAVQRAVDGMELGDGGDSPENYARVFHESYADPDVSWRPGAKRVVVNFGDAVPHDDLKEGVADGVWNTGVDPGRDEEIRTADDLDLQTVLREMDRHGVTLLEAHTRNYRTPWGRRVLDYWDVWTGVTGGSTFLTGEDTMVTDVVTEVREAARVTEAEGLRVEASPGYREWVGDTRSVDVPVGETASFGVEVTVPEDAEDGTHRFALRAVDRRGVEHGSTEVAVTVRSRIEARVDVKPGSDRDPVNLRSRGVLPVAVLTADELDARDVDPGTVRVSGGAPVHAGHLEDVDGDGDRDLVVHVPVRETDLTPDSTAVELRAETRDGVEVVGSDGVRVLTRGKGRTAPERTGKDAVPRGR